jgi:succinate-acetate transporter protein
MIRSHWMTGDASQIPLAPAAPRIAEPWVLGLYGMAGATFVVAAHLAGWYGGPGSAWLLVPFAAVLGGLAQFLAGMWAYAAGDALATAMLGTWGSFWLAYGLVHALAGAGRLSVPQGAVPELGFWFIALAAITWMGAVAATRTSAALATVLVALAAGATIGVFAEMFGIGALTVLAGWIFVIAAICAWYTATAMMLGDAFGREVLPLGAARPARVEPSPAGVPGSLRESPTAQHAR